MKRIDALKKLAFAQNGFNGHFVFNSTNLLYFLGFPGTSALLIPEDGEPTVYVYSVNYEQAKAQAKSFKVEVVTAEENLMEKIAQQARERKLKSIAIDSLNVDNWRTLTKALSQTMTFEVNSKFVQELRKTKDEEEIALMRKAGELTSEGMKTAYETVRLGVKEYEVAAEIEYAMRKRGSGTVAFETIVASGACSAFPHGGCFDREIRDGDLVVIDIGATYHFYCSDMTRTIVAGKPTEKQKNLHHIVHSAQNQALKVLQAGVKVADVDFAARKVIADAGYADNFVHRLGHGVGLEVHELPVLSSTSNHVLVADNVVTVEPGIYIPGYGGIRIEDTVLVRKNGGEKLTSGSYSLTAE